MHDCNSEYIVDFYGAFQNESGDVIMCMEYMDVGYASPHLRFHGQQLTCI
jgi:serine/threonine protein kinase